MRKKIVGIAATGITMLATVVASGAAANGTTTAGTTTAGTTTAGTATGGSAAWCSRQGGVPATFYPYYGDSPVFGSPLGGKRVFCVFTSATDGSQITVAADSLAADKPTLVSLAYWRKPNPPAPPPPGNPSTQYCHLIGGTATFGDRPGDMGGWAPAGAVDLTSMCMFADGSTIDTWGLFYHTQGFVRGADLTDKFRAKNPPQKAAPYRR